ncbi:MAG: hypothetical protein LIO74_08520 [Ruminococcus sp.]|nr:hypothetical protein [Ruminococcus sp.]
MEQQKKYLEGSNLYWTKIAGLLALLDAVVMTIVIFANGGLRYYFYYGFHYGSQYSGDSYLFRSVVNNFLPSLLAFALAILFLAAKGRSTKSKCGKATVIIIAAFFVCRIMDAFGLWGGMPSLLSFTDMTAVFYGNGSFF